MVERIGRRDSEKKLAMQGHRPAKISWRDDSTEIECSGEWLVNTIAELDQKFAYFNYVTPAAIQLNASKITKLDTAGAWMLAEFIRQLRALQKKVSLIGLSPVLQAVYDLVADETAKLIPPPRPESRAWLYVLGKNTVTKWQEAHSLVAFIGELVTNIIFVISHPRQIQWRSFLNVIDQAGFRALPIIGLLLFLIGIVISYQSGIQLKTYGANIYIVSLTGVAILQEFGPMITAIILAGRTAAAFTAQIGSMKVNQELDALSTMGLSPINMLVVPRFFAMLIVVPLLAVWADFFGILGSMVMAKHTLGISYTVYLNAFPRDVKFTTYLVGMCKTPVFAMIIATVGCFQGFQVAYSADSVGAKTTKSVVQAIFLIIIVDAAFSVLFGW